MEPTIYKPSIYNGAGIYKSAAGGGGGGGVDVSEYFILADAAVVINAYKLDNLLHIHFEWNYNLHQNSVSGDNTLLATLTGASFKFKYKFQQTVTGCYDNNKMPSDRIGYIGNWGTTDNSYYTDRLIFKTGSSVRFWYCDFVVEVTDA